MSSNRRLRLKIDGEHLTHDKFLRAVQSFFGVLKEVAAEVTGSPKSIEWLVSAKSGSVDLISDGRARGKLVPIDLVVNATYFGLKKLQSKGVRPPHFNDEALQNARELGKLADGKSIDSIKVLRSRNRFSVSAKVVPNVDRILGGDVVEIGSIEGRLQMISSRGSLHVGVWDDIWGRRVRCFIRPEMEDEVKDAFRHRVSVNGLIRLKKTGEPVSIEVESVDIIPPDKELPTADEVCGILAEIV